MQWSDSCGVVPTDTCAHPTYVYHRGTRSLVPSIIGAHVPSIIEALVPAHKELWLLSYKHQIMAG